MPVDKKVLESCIAQASQGDTELADFMRKKYEASDTLAAKFVAGYMTESDYTRKSQALAEDRKSLDGQRAEMDTLRTRLETAEAEKDKIMRDLAERNLTAKHAETLLENVKRTYALTDEDIPGMTELIATRKTGRVQDDTPSVAEQIQTALKAERASWDKEFTTRFLPEMGAQAILPAIWDEIGREHQELTGKALTFKEKQEILEGARKNNLSLVQQWEGQFSVSGQDGLRMKKTLQTHEQTLRSQWEKEEADKRSKEALAIVSPGEGLKPSGAGISSAFQTDFKTYQMDPNAAPAAPGSKAGEVPTMAVAPGTHIRQPGGSTRIPAAQRAAQKFVEKGGIGGFQKTA